LWCLDPPNDPPECEEYCALVDVACTGDLAQYETTEQCMNVCEALDQGLIKHTVENTVGCRRYHTFNSMAVPGAHCFHAGPLGDGHCGVDDEEYLGNCDSYCQLLDAACTDEFEGAFENHDACMADCASQPTDFLAAKDLEYTVTAGKVEDDTLHCRTLHLVRAFEDPSECDAAMGGDPCD
jgi:hypothetical protein